MFEFPVLQGPELMAAGAASADRPRWHIRVLGAVDAIDPQGARATISRWPTRAVAALLARLALGADRAHPREELVELLWPGVELGVGRNRLRQALSTLKSLLEVRQVPGGAVITADHVSIRVVPGALSCDATAFEQRLRAGDWQAARALYRGDLMPGYYDEWVQDERRRLLTLWDRLDRASPLLPPPLHQPVVHVQGP